MNDYSQKSIDDFELVLVTPSPKVTDQEKKCVRNSFDALSQDQCIETTSKIILTHILRRSDDIKPTSHPSTGAMTPAETVALWYQACYTTLFRSNRVTHRAMVSAGIIALVLGCAVDLISSQRLKT